MDRATSSRIYHAACGKWWTGLGVHHCGGCHRSFSGLRAFTQHRVTPEGGEPGEHECVDPSTVGLERVESRKFECWGYPRDPDAPKWWLKYKNTDTDSDDSADEEDDSTAA